MKCSDDLIREFLADPDNGITKCRTSKARVSDGGPQRVMPNARCYRAGGTIDRKRVKMGALIEAHEPFIAHEDMPTGRHYDQKIKVQGW